MKTTGKMANAIKRKFGLRINVRLYEMFKLVSPSSLVSSFHPAFSAVNWPVWVGNEGNLAFRAAFRADCLVHFFLSHFHSSTPYVLLCKKALHDHRLPSKVAYKSLH